MRPPNPNTHHACRSLLQKAVRRGNASIASKVADHLWDVGDAAWLKRRVAVIFFEECWPLAAELDTGTDRAGLCAALARAARSVKFKDAAGLGSLSYALSQGDRTVLKGAPDDRHINVIREAINRPDDFWKWAGGACTSEAQSKLVSAARTFYRRGGWPWDRAFMQAAAYLSVTHDLPDVPQAKEGGEPELPLWVALDKHTPHGKAVLRDVSKITGVPWTHVIWTSFYFESALTNAAAPSPWWLREVEWRIGKLGLSPDAARNIWSKLQGHVSESLANQAEELRSHLEEPAAQRQLII